MLKDFFILINTSGVRRIADQSSISTKTVRDDSNIMPKTLNSIAADANCILHLFGSWLFDVCLSGVDLPKVLTAVGIISSGSKPNSYRLSREDLEVGRRYVCLDLKFEYFFLEKVHTVAVFF